MRSYNTNNFLQYACVLGLMIHHPTQAEEELKAATSHQKSDRHFAILVNPLVPLILDAIQNELDEQEGNLIGIGAFDINLRAHQIVTKEMGYTLQFEYSQLSFFTQTTYVGVRGGPRFSFRNKGLTDWSWMPFILLGRNVISAGTHSFCSWATLGAGAEIDFTWFWGDVLLEMGLGGYSTQNFAYTTYSETFTDTTAPPPLSPWKPLLTLGIGYAF